MVAALVHSQPTASTVKDGVRDERLLIERARYHGMLPLIAAALSSRRDAARWPARLNEACSAAAQAQARYELVHEWELRRVLGALDEAAIEVLLLKGTALAYDCYSESWHRPRVDTDLLVAPERAEAAERILAGLGYRRVASPAGRYVGYQSALQCRDRHGVLHNLDLHWRISNEQRFAWCFEFPELVGASVPLPKLTPHARCLGHVHALALCLMHRAGNNRFEGAGFGDRLIWLYDMHLLLSAMSDAEIAGFAAAVARARLGAIAIEGLRACLLWFPSGRLRMLVETLERATGAREGADWLRAGRLRHEWLELRSIPGVASRLRYLVERAFPSAAYMRERYPEAEGAVTWLHLRRIGAALTGPGDRAGK